MIHGLINWIVKIRNAYVITVSTFYLISDGVKSSNIVFKYIFLSNSDLLYVFCLSLSFWNQQNTNTASL